MGGKTTSRVYRAAREGLAEAWNVNVKQVLAVREGGTMAVLPVLQTELGCDAVQMALSQASGAAHLPNERMSRLVLARAVDAIAAALTLLGTEATNVPTNGEEVGNILDVPNPGETDKSDMLGRVQRPKPIQTS